MRKLGIAVLGLLVGPLAGFLITEVIATVVVLGVGDGQVPDSLLLTALLGSLTPFMSVVGVLVALVIHGGRRRDVVS